MIPAINPITLTADLASAVGQGIHDALGDLGVSTPASVAVGTVGAANALAKAANAEAASPHQTTPAPQPVERNASAIRSSVAAAAKPARPQDHSPVRSPLSEIGNELKDAVSSLAPKPVGPEKADSGSTAASARGGTGRGSGGLGRVLPKTGGQRCRHPCLQSRTGFGVLGGIDVAVVVQARDQIAAFVGNRHVHGDLARLDQFTEAGTQPLDTSPVCAETNTAPVAHGATEPGSDQRRHRSC